MGITFRSSNTTFFNHGGASKKTPCISHESSSIFQMLINKSTFLESNQFWFSWRTRKGPLEINWECHRMAATLWIHELELGKKYLVNKCFHWKGQLLCLENVFAFLCFPFNGNFSRFPCSCYEKNLILMLKLQEDQDTLALELRSRKWSRCRQNLTIKKVTVVFQRQGRQPF